MKQYCRYCIYLTCGDVPFCFMHETTMKESTCKKPNKCKDFVLCEAEAEYQDAFGENRNGYKPRDKINDGEQETMF